MLNPDNEIDDDPINKNDKYDKKSFTKEDRKVIELFPNHLKQRGRKKQER